MVLELTKTILADSIEITSSKDGHVRSTHMFPLETPNETMLAFALDYQQGKGNMQMDEGAVWV